MISQGIELSCYPYRVDTKITILFTPKFNYELFNYSNFSIRYWSWNYRGCWHQTCPPIVPRESDVNCAHSNCSPYISRVLHCYFLSLPPCVRIGQFARLLPSLEVGAVSPGSLSGIEPQFSVTRHHHGRPRPDHRRLMGQKFEWSTAGLTFREKRPCGSRSYHESPTYFYVDWLTMKKKHKNTKRFLKPLCMFCLFFICQVPFGFAFVSNKCGPSSVRSRSCCFFCHVLALELPRLSTQPCGLRNSPWRELRSPQKRTIK